MQDVIIFVPDFLTLVGYLDQNHPDMLERDEDGNMTNPPVVVGFARTPATIGPDQNSLMVYARLREEEILEWGNMPYVEVLAQVEFTGQGTGQAVYNQVFNDPIKAEKYDSVYNREPYQVDDGEGGTTTVTPPQMFGLLAGA